MKRFGVLLILAALAVAPLSRADSDALAPDLDPLPLLEKARAHRPTNDMALKARLSLTRNSEKIFVEILVKAGKDETRTLYRVGSTEALVVQPTEGEPRYFLRGTGELTGEARLHKLAGSQFTLYDLGLPFLHWTNAKYLGIDRQRGRDCDIIEVTHTNAPYRKVKIWLDQEFHALLRAEALNEHDQPIRRFSVTSFRKLGERWIPRGLEMSYVPHGQSLPSAETSRLEIYEADYDAKLSEEEFKY